MPTRVLVYHDGFGTGTLNVTRTDTASVSSINPVHTYQTLNVSSYELPPSVDLGDALSELEGQPGVVHVEEDLIRQISADPLRDWQWNMDLLDAEGAWEYTQGQGVTVAVIDTGCSSGPLDGLPTLIPGFDFVNNDSDPSDDNGHGTHVAGTIAQATDNDKGLIGLAPSAQILAVKSFDSYGYAYTSDILAGVEYAIEEGVDVINMSYGGAGETQAEAQLMAQAVAAGIVLVAASGNSGSSQVDFPAGYPGVLAVGATGVNSNRATYSSFGSGLDLMAPGGESWVDRNNDGRGDGIYQESIETQWGFYGYNGTSMAAPHVAASAALLMSAGLNREQTITALQETAEDLGNSGWDRRTGWGMVQPEVALSDWVDDTASACEVNITNARYRARMKRLIVRAETNRPNETLRVYANNELVGILWFNNRRQAFRRAFQWPVLPTTLTVESDCGGSDSRRVRRRP